MVSASQGSEESIKRAIRMLSTQMTVMVRPQRGLQRGVVVARHRRSKGRRVTEKSRENVLEYKYHAAGPRRKTLLFKSRASHLSVRADLRPKHDEVFNQAARPGY